MHDMLFIVSILTDQVPEHVAHNILDTIFANKHMKSAQFKLLTREMQIKTVSNYLTIIGIRAIKKSKNTVLRMWRKGTLINSIRDNN